MPPQGPPQGMDPNAMFQPQGEIFDDLGAVEMANDDAYHARDVPQDWADANPYEIDTAPEAGSGYEDMAFDQAGMPPMDGLAGAPQSADDAAAMKEALLGRMQQDASRSQEFQDQAVQGNLQERKLGQKMGY